MYIFTFLEYIFCREKAIVEARALRSPSILKLSSVKVAIATPPTMGTRLE